MEPEVIIFFVIKNASLVVGNLVDVSNIPTLSIRINIGMKKGKR